MTEIEVDQVIPVALIGKIRGGENQLGFVFDFGATIRSAQAPAGINPADRPELTAVLAR